MDRPTEESSEEAEDVEHRHIDSVTYWQLQKDKSEQCPKVDAATTDLWHLGHGGEEHGTEAVTTVEE